jgi:hypothetical protein
METLDVLLGNQDITSHLQVSSACLSCQNIGLAFLERVLNDQELLSLYVSAEASLDLSCSVLATEHSITSVTHFCDKALDLSLNHDQSFALSLELLSLSV